VEAFASVFSLLLGYSRVPYARQQMAITFQLLPSCTPSTIFPYVSLLALGGAAALFCFLRLADVIAALVVIRILLQFLFRPSGSSCCAFDGRACSTISHVAVSASRLFAIGGFVFVLWKRPDPIREIRYALSCWR